MGKINSYKDLIVWQKSMVLVTETYAMAKFFPENERYGLTSQLTRASVSVPSNIAEGWGRESSKSYMQFLKIARGSLMEVETLLTIAQRLNYINEDLAKKNLQLIEEISKMLNSLLRSINEKIIYN